MLSRRELLGATCAHRRRVVSPRRLARRPILPVRPSDRPVRRRRSERSRGPADCAGALTDSANNSMSRTSAAPVAMWGRGRPPALPRWPHDHRGRAELRRQSGLVRQRPV